MPDANFYVKLFIGAAVVDMAVAKGRADELAEENARLQAQVTQLQGQTPPKPEEP